MDEQAITREILRAHAYKVLALQALGIALSLLGAIITLDRPFLQIWLASWNWVVAIGITFVPPFRGVVETEVERTAISFYRFVRPMLILVALSSTARMFSMSIAGTHAIVFLLVALVLLGFCVWSLRWRIVLANTASYVIYFAVALGMITIISMI